MNLVKTVGSVFLGMIVILGVVFFGMSSEFFQLSSISIVPSENIVSKTSFNLIKKKVLKKLSKNKKKSLWSLNLDNITADVMKEKWVKRIRISRSLPNKLNVWLDLKNVGFLLLSPKGNLYQIALDGTLLGAIKKSEKVDVPVFTGKTLWKSQSYRKQVVNLMSLLPDEGVLSLRSFSEITYSKKEGLIGYLVNGGIKVIFGESVFFNMRNRSKVESVDVDFDLESEKKKLDRLRKVLSYVYAKKIKVKTVDSRLSKKILVKLEGASYLRPENTRH